LWCIPCGYVEYDEDVFDAAAREFKEETNLDIKINGFIRYSQIFTTRKRILWDLVYGRGYSGELKAQADLDEVGYFDLAAPPSWLSRLTAW
jgi:8-oxo-dGTP pyrophosphatase MutT (NUDIX family)